MRSAYGILLFDSLFEMCTVSHKQWSCMLLPKANRDSRGGFQLLIVGILADGMSGQADHAIRSIHRLTNRLMKAPIRCISSGCTE